MGIKTVVSQSDVRKMTKHLARNLRFGAVMALNRTAERLQKEIIVDLRGVFTIRGNWVTGSIKTDKGNPTDRTAMPKAVVGTIQPFMLAQETGGDRLKKESTEWLSAPLYARHDPSMRTPPPQWAGSLLRRGMARGPMGPNKPERTLRPGPRGPTGSLVRKRGAMGPDGPLPRAPAHGISSVHKRKRKGLKFFVLSHGGKTFVMERLNKSGSDLRAWYTLKPKFHLKGEWHFGRHFVPIAERWVQAEMLIQIDKALKT